MKTTKNNKGFSLVELIVVVAIMAVLMAVLVPTLVRQVEKSKQQKDLSAISEVKQQVLTTLADPNFSDLHGTVECTDGSVEISADFISANLAEDEDADPKFADELEENVGSDTVSLASKEYKAATITFYIGNEKCVATVTNKDNEEINIDTGKVVTEDEKGAATEE